MAADAVYHLGIPESQFWKLTPKKYKALMTRHRESMEMRYVVPVAQFAHFISLWVNSKYPDAKSKPDDFIPKLSPSPGAPGPQAPKPNDGSHRLAQWRAFDAAVKSR